MIRVHSLLVGLLMIVFGIDVSAQEQREKPRSNDSITIVSVASEKPVKDGVANEFTIEIQYTLDAADEATVSIGFNSDDPGSYRMTATKKVSRGTATVTLRARTVPKDWKERGDFFVNAILGPISPDTKFRPYAGTQKHIEVQP